MACVLFSDLVIALAIHPVARFALVAAVVLAVIYVGVKGVRALRRGAEIAVGDVLDHRFDSPFLEDRRIESLADLRGKPVFILNWGKL